MTLTELVLQRSEHEGDLISARVVWPVGLFQAGECAFCECPTPPPDANALDFVVRNHDASRRLLFPHAEDCYPERDCWPVTGWRECDGMLLCDQCAEKRDAALAALRRKPPIRRP